MRTGPALRMPEFFAWRRICAGLVMALFAATGARAADSEPPCGTSVRTDLPLPGAPPAIAILRGGEAQRWQPPSCTGWPPPSKLVIALKGSFRFEGSMNDLLARLGAISALANIRYWSVTDSKWLALARAASALRGPDPRGRRPDFSGLELIQGATLYYWVDDTRSGDITYRLKVRERTADRVLIVSENVTPVRRFLMTLFKPGALQSALVVQRLSPGVFGLYILSRTGEGTSLLATGHDSSYVNRANALFRQMAGVKTDLEPPAAR
jgi:hypothetical protein